MQELMQSFGFTRIYIDVSSNTILLNKVQRFKCETVETRIKKTRHHLKQYLSIDKNM